MLRFSLAIAMKSGERTKSPLAASLILPDTLLNGAQITVVNILGIATVSPM
jgi:hypothetical protein